MYVCRKKNVDKQDILISVVAGVQYITKKALYFIEIIFITE